MQFGCIFKHCFATAESWKNVVGAGVMESLGKVLEFFVSKRVGTLLIAQVCTGFTCIGALLCVSVKEECFQSIPEFGEQSINQNLFRLA